MKGCNPRHGNRSEPLLHPMAWKTPKNKQPTWPSTTPMAWAKKSTFFFFTYQFAKWSVLFFFVPCYIYIYTVYINTQNSRTVAGTGKLWGIHAGSAAISQVVAPTGEKKKWGTFQMTVAGELVEIVGLNVMIMNFEKLVDLYIVLHVFTCFYSTIGMSDWFCTTLKPVFLFVQIAANRPLSLCHGNPSNLDRWQGSECTVGW